jgi:hypothetical protein
MGASAEFSFSYKTRACARSAIARSTVATFCRACLGRASSAWVCREAVEGRRPLPRRLAAPGVVVSTPPLVSSAESGLVRSLARRTERVRLVAASPGVVVVHPV